MREIDYVLMHDNLHSGLPKHHASAAAVRGFGPLWPLYSATGANVHETSSAHPFGPNKRKYVRDEFPDAVALGNDTIDQVSAESF